MRFAHLRAWCDMMGSHAYYTKAQIEEATRTNAPADAIYLEIDRECGGTARWVTFAEVTSATTRRMIESRLNNQKEEVTA